jgi:type I restriction enzyme, S subunit
MVIFRAARDHVLPRYLYFFLRSSTFREQIDSLRSGTAQPQLPIRDIGKVQLPIPPIDEQRAIAYILGTLDDKIELSGRINVTLEAIARAIFKAWFVDFDPVRAKASGEPRESICRRLGFTPELLALFPERFQDSELGEIPEGWNVEPVDALAEAIFSGGTPDTRRPEYWDGEYSWFSSGETRNRFVISTERKITAKGVAASSTRAARPEDILIASAGQGLTRGQTSYCAIDTYINQSVVCVRANTSRTHPLWLFYDLSGRYEEMRAFSDSHSSRGSLTTKLIGSISVCYPGEALSQHFGVTMQSLVNAQIGNLRATDLLTNIRDALLPKLLSGQLRASDGAA